MTIELKPCPFCGGTASVHNDTDGPMWFAGCANSECPVEPHLYCSRRLGAAEAWNRRAELADAQAEIARLRGALESASNYIDNLGGVSKTFRSYLNQ